MDTTDGQPATGTESSGQEEEFVWDGSMEGDFMAELGLAMQAEACAIPTAGEHVHGPGCGHSHQEDATPDMQELETNLIEVAHALQDRYGDAGPTPEQEKEFMREWLLGKGKTEEQVNEILSSS